jgi:hypothetical protein
MRNHAAASEYEAVSSRGEEPAKLGIFRTSAHGTYTPVCGEYHRTGMPGIPHYGGQFESEIVIHLFQRIGTLVHSPYHVYLHNIATHSLPSLNLYTLR